MFRWLVLPMVAVASFSMGRWSQSGAAETGESTRDSQRERLTFGPRRAVEASGSAKYSPRAPASNKQPTAPVELPFLPGDAENWIRQQIKRGGWKDDPAAIFRVAQTYSAMDEASISEVVSTFQKLVHRRQTAGPAELADYPKEWLFKLGVYPALFRYSQLNPEAALDLIKADPILSNPDLYQVALSNMTALDPDRALAHVEGLEGMELRQGMEPILGTLFSSDPDRVIRLLEDYPDEIFDGERRKVAERLAAEDPLKAIDFATGAIRAGRNPDVLQVAVNVWRERFPEEANRWVETYDGPGHEALK